MRMEFEESSMLKPHMRVVLDTDGNMDFQKRDWEEFKKLIDDYFATLK